MHSQLILPLFEPVFCSKTTKYPCKVGDRHRFDNITRSNHQTNTAINKLLSHHCNDVHLHHILSLTMRSTAYATHGRTTPATTRLALY